MRMRFLSYACNFCLTYNVTSTMNYHLEINLEKLPSCELTPDSHYIENSLLLACSCFDNTDVVTRKVSGNNIRKESRQPLH